MTFSTIGAAPTGVTAYRINPGDPSQGYRMQVGTSVVDLTAEQADNLGRYLLFDDAPSNRKEAS